MIGPILGGRVARLKFDPSTLAVTFDGNSHVSIIRESGQFPTLPANMGSVPINNIGIGGETWRRLNGLDGGSAADVDAAYVEGKTNVLIAWEGTNTLRDLTRSAAQSWQDCIDYCNARQAYVANNRPGQRPWIILLGTCLPLGANYQYGPPGPRNDSIDAYNVLMRQNYRQVAKGLFDVREVGSIFEGELGKAAITSGQYAQGDSLHSSYAGYISVCTNQIVPALKRLPAR